MICAHNNLDQKQEQAIVKINFTNYISGEISHILE